MKSGYITELFSSFQGEGPYVGRRQIFIRFAGCPYSCFYCDTQSAKESKPSLCTVFGNAGNNNSFGKAFLSKKRFFENPMSSHFVLELLTKLRTPDLHSVSYTGGEPLFSAAFVKEIAKGAREMHLKNYIETNGYSARAFAFIADHFDFASIDIKLKRHQASTDYDKQYKNELECIKISASRGLETIVKVVVIKGTAIEEIEEICKDLVGLNIKFVLQPVAGDSAQRDIVPGMKELFAISEFAGAFLPDVMVIPQVHKMLCIP
ncbi:Organic radical activating enzyme [Methanophagales archaeon]|nr:Organic radical activating enzyme [Methanophagales archaeon]